MRCFGFALLNYKMLTAKTAKGVSAKSLELYIVVFVCRLLSILRHQGIIIITIMIKFLILFNNNYQHFIFYFFRIFTI